MRERAERHDLHRPVTVLHDGKERLVGTLNLSLSGACLSGLGPVAVGAFITIRDRALAIEAHVVWTGGAVTGVQFLSPLSPEELQALQLG